MHFLLNQVWKEFEKLESFIHASFSIHASVSKLFGYRDPSPCLDTKAPRYPKFYSSYPNLDTETPLLVIRYPNKFYLI